jgi:hypothetical protein
LLPVLCLALVGLVGCGSATTSNTVAEPQRTGPARTLRLALAKGDKLHYEATTSARSEVSDKEKIKQWPKEYHEPASMDADGTVDILVTKVENGLTTVQIDTKLTRTEGKGWGERDAKEAMATKVPRQTVTYDARLANQKPDVPINPVINSIHRLYPERAVGIGSTWTYEPFAGVKEANVKYEAEEEIAGEACAKLVINLPEARPGDKTLMTVWCSLKTGWILKFALDMESETDGLKTFNVFSQTVVKK